jgi:hypothetical protein
MAISVPVLPLRVPLGVFIAAIALLPVMTYLSWLSIFYMEGRVAGYLPTFSETATEYPNSKIAALCWTGIAGICLPMRLLLHAYMSITYPIGPVYKWVFPFYLVFTDFSLVALCFFPMNDNLFWHFATAISHLGNSAISQIVAWIVSFPYTAVSTSCMRLAFIVAQILGLAATGLSGPVVGNRGEITLSAVGEYLYAISMPAFYLSFAQEIGKLSMFCLSLESIPAE